LRRAVEDGSAVFGTDAWTTRASLARRATRRWRGSSPPSSGAPARLLALGPRALARPQPDPRRRARAQAAV